MRKGQIIIAGTLLLFLAGCFPTPTPVPTQVVLPSEAPIVETAAPTFVVVTSTPEPVEPTVPLPTETQANLQESITLKEITDLGGGKAAVTWDANGNFLSGFRIVWSDVNTDPIYLRDSSVDVVDPTLRSAMFTGEYGKIYYVRVCRIVNDICDLYSNRGIFAFFAPGPTALPSTTLTPTATKWVITPNSPGGNGGGTAVTPFIKITSITNTDPGKARITWEATGTFTNGFKIVYSRSSNPPVYGTDSYYAIDNGAYRTAYLDGKTGYTYYYRICRWTGTTCDTYSNTYTFTYAGDKMTATVGPSKTPTLTKTPGPSKTPTITRTPTITKTPVPSKTPTVTATSSVTSIAISGISNVTTGQATVFWTATGSFPNGFKLLYSRTNNPPTLADGSVAQDSWDSGTGIGSATFNGDPGKRYFIRVCKFDGSACVAYSTALSFTFAPAPDTVVISYIANVSSGVASVHWAADGTYDYGYAIIYSDTNPTPALATDDHVTVDSSYVAANINGTPGTEYYFVVCALTSESVCGVTSDVETYTYP